MYANDPSYQKFNMTISFTQEVSGDTILVKLYSSTSLSTTSSLALSFSYIASGVGFDSISFAGSSSSSISSSILGSTGTAAITAAVSLNGAIDAPFATLTFTATGSGTFDLNMSSVKLNSLSEQFTDPPPFAYVITNLPLVIEVSLLEDQSSTAEFDPFNSIFGPPLSIVDQANHGLVTIVKGFYGSNWAYVPTANFNGLDSFTIRATEGTKTKDLLVNAKITPVNDSPTGTVTIGGTATQGQVLTTSNTLADADGLGSISYQWQAGGVSIAGATGSTFTLSQAEVGKAIAVTASYTDAFGTAESKTSSATALVMATTAPTVATFSPTDEATGIAIGSNIVVTFSEAIARGVGSIILKDSTGVAAGPNLP